MPRRRLLQGWILACLAGTTFAAPIPHSLVGTIHSPATARQSGTQLGYSVALDGNLAVIASPFDNLGGEESGVVGVYSASTGALLHLLANPLPENGSRFGWSVAVSGSRIAVGVPGGDGGANDSGFVCLFDLASATPAIPHVIQNPNPALNDRFGTSVAIEGNRVIVGAPFGDSGAGDAGCAYVYDLAGSLPTQPAFQLNNPDPAGRNFGHAVAISGLKVAVGTPQDAGTGDSSRVHLYDLAGATPTVPVLSLADPTPANNEAFGRAVALAGNLLAVGVPLEDGGADNAGAVRVYRTDSATPSVPEWILPNPSPALNDSFGSSLSLSGSRLAVGSPLDDQGGSDSGRAHVFDLASPTPTVATHVLDNPGPQSNDQFGNSVALSGNRLLTGAHGDNTGVSDSGSGYVFEVPAGSPAALQQIVNTPSPPSEEKFGNAVAIHGSLVAAGAFNDDKGNSSNSGSAFVFDMNAPDPGSPALSLENPAPATNDYFGGAVAIEGQRIAVSAYQDDIGATNAGTVYLYDRNSATPQVPVLTIPNPAPQSQDQFGNSLALSGGLLVVGASKNDVGGFLDAGSAYVFDLSSPTPAVPVAVLDNPAPGTNELFGYAVGISGRRIAIGVPGNPVNALASAGSVYVYDLDSATPAMPVAVIDNPAPAIGDEFGHSVGISGPWMVAGSPYADQGARDAGRAFSFRIDSATPSVPVHLLNNPDPEPEDYHGSSIAISGTRVVIGAPETDSGAEDSGSALVHELSSATAAVPAAILDPLARDDGDLFGHAVAIDNGNIVVSALLADGNTFDRGAVHLFDPDPPLPLLQVEQPAGTGLIAGTANVSFGYSPEGEATGPMAIVIRNVGTDTLTVSGISNVEGSDPDFTITAPPLPLVLEVDESASISVAFVPATSGSRSATLRIISDSSGYNPFDVTLSGQGLSAAEDTDGDGLNDVVELRLEALGFDWQVNDEELAGILLSGANASGLYSASQIQGMNPGTTYLPRDPGTGKFKLTIAVKGSPDLMNFQLRPMSPPAVNITPQGKLEFRVASPGPRGFYRLEPR